MQMCCSPYERVWSCATDTYKSEGLKAFYRSYPTGNYWKWVSNVVPLNDIIIWDFWYAIF